MRKKFFRLKNGDKNFCRLYLPYKGAKNIPVIIYCHGWTKPILGGGRIYGGAPKQVRDEAIKTVWRLYRSTSLANIARGEITDTLLMQDGAKA